MLIAFLKSYKIISLSLSLSLSLFLSLSYRMQSKTLKLLFIFSYIDVLHQNIKRLNIKESANF